MIKEEKRILRIITRINDQRNRACFQNILAFVQRERKDFDMEECKKIVGNLVKKNMLINKGSSKTIDSFKVVDKKVATDNASPKKQNGDGNDAISSIGSEFVRKIGEKIQPELENKDGEGSKLITAMETLIQDKFYDTVSNLIKKEVIQVIKSLKNDDCVINNEDILITNNDYSQLKEISTIQKKEIERLTHEIVITKSQQNNYANNIGNQINRNIIDNKCLNDLIETQRKDIEFLRNELQSKDQIIQILLSDKKDDKINVENKLHEQDVKETIDDFINPKIKQRKEVNKKRSVVILGDSLLKDIEQNKVRKGLGGNEKVYVKCFPGATTKHMRSYINPSKDFNNDLVLIHCGTNDLRGDKQSKDIANEIIDLAMEMKTDVNEVIISSILPRRDKLNVKAIEVNKFLFSFCSKKKLHCIDNSNIDPNKHLNNSGLHLNYEGTYVLGSNFVYAIKI